jgi:hypothetical protein
MALHMLRADDKAKDMAGLGSTDLNSKRAMNDGKDNDLAKTDRVNRFAAGAQPLMKREEAVQSPDVAASNRVKAFTTSQPLVVREYAAPRPGVQDAESEIPDTILWQPVIVLPGDGKTKLTFQLGSARGYQLVVAGHTLNGRIGAIRELIPVAPQSGQSAPPVTIPPTMP